MGIFHYLYFKFQPWIVLIPPAWKFPGLLLRFILAMNKYVHTLVGSVSTNWTNRTREIVWKKKPIDGSELHYLKVEDPQLLGYMEDLFFKYK